MALLELPAGSLTYILFIIVFGVWMLIGVFVSREVILVLLDHNRSKHLTSDEEPRMYYVSKSRVLKQRRKKVSKRSNSNNSNNEASMRLPL